jgi:uncharacterized protein
VVFAPPVAPGTAERRLHPKVRVVWWIGWVISDLMLIGGLTVGAVVLDANTDVSLPAALPWYATALAVLAVAARTWYTFAAYRAWRYRFTSTGIELRSGVFWKQASAMPYHRLQQVDVGQGPLERWLGMSSVQLRTAAATTDASIPGIAQSEVEDVRRLLMQRAGRDDGT